MDQAHPIHANTAVASLLASAGVHWRLVPFDREGWSAEFPDDTVVTPFGPVDIHPECIEAPDVGVSLIGLIRPVLEKPSYVVRHDGDQTVTFVRAVTGPDGDVRGYGVVVLAAQTLRVYVSEQPPGDLLLPPAIPATMTAESDEDGEPVFKALALALPERTIIVTDSALAWHLLGAPIDLIKSDHGPIPPDARWITVHPNGPGSKGQPVLVVPAGEGGAMRVIGGAGGKLNMLKLRGVQSEADYKLESAKRQADKRKARKDQIAKDKALGLHEAKDQARKALFEQTRKARATFVKTVAQTMGWDESALTLDTSELTPEAAKKAQRRHEAELLKRAREAVDLQRRALVADVERRKAAQLDTVPFSAGPEALGVEDLAPGKVPDGSGISISFGQEAAKHGLTPEKVEAEEAAVAAGQGKPLDPEKLHDKEKIKAAIDAEMAKLKQPDLLASIVDAHKAVDLVKQLKALTALERQASKARAEVDTSTVEPKAYVLATTAPSDADIDKMVEEQVATRQAAAFLAGTKEVGTEAELRSHVSAGAYNALNALQQAVGGAALVDRMAVDVLGVAGAAQALTHRLRASYGADADHIAAGLAEYHVAEAPKQQAEALEHAKELQDAAAAIELGEAHTAHDLVTAAALNQKRLDHLGEARKVLGQALGEQEARAAMIAALEGPSKDTLEVSLGHASVESAMQQLYALGLTTDEFSIEKAGGNTFAKINPVGLDRLAAPVDYDNIARVERNLAIMKGSEDEPDWLPNGFAKRPDLGLDLKPGVAPRMSSQFDASAADLTASLKSYIGGRIADGDLAADVLADIQSASFFAKVGQARAEEYAKALDAAVPTKKAGGGLARVEDLAPVFEQYADDFAASLGGTRSTLNRQRFEPDAISQEALHRALSDEPTGKLAYKPVGDLSASERGELRDWFFKNVAKESPEQADLRHAAEKLAGAEPPKEATDMFGDMAANPAWTDWKVEHDEAVQKANNAGLDWPRYCKIMGGPTKAIETVQDLVRSKVSEGFAQAHNRLRPGKPLAIGTTVVRNNLRHLGAVDPAEREKRVATERALIDSLRNRVKGKYVGGSVAEKIDQHKAYEAAFGQAQMGFFSSDELGGDDNGPKSLIEGERRTIGQAAESMIGKMMGVVGDEFKPGQPVKLFRPTMSGPEGIKRQRAIKLIAANKRVALGAGVGSGKTAMMLGGFSQLKSDGKAKKGVFVVPSIVQGQFGAEALRFLEPGKFHWHAEPGASYADRLASYKDPGNDFTVVTHQSFRDDLLKMAVEAGKAASPEAAAAALEAMDRKGRQAWMKGVLEHHGINPDFVAVDEGHGLLDREGKEDSRMSTAIGAVSDLSPYYVHASADPVKNDASEAFSLLQKMDPERYADRGAFMRRYGGDTVAAKEGLRREMARHLYTFAAKPDVAVNRQELKVPVSEAQKAALSQLEAHAAALRIAEMEGKPNIDAAKALSPHLFDGVPEEAWPEIARRVAKSVGIVKDSATRRILDNHPSSGKLAELAKQAAARKGKQGVVFAHSLEAVEAISQRLEKDGHRVIRLTGKDSSAEKDAKLRKFRPDKGEPQADIVVASDAGATGANMQSGSWLAQYDTPDTAMAQPLDSLVLCPSGWRRMGDLVSGDEVMTPCGARAVIEGVYPQGVKPIHRLTFSDGATALACGDHLWASQSRDDDRKGRGWRVRTTEHLARTLLDAGRSRYRIPLVGHIDCEAQPLLIPPYTLGTLLGDGHFGGSHVALSSVDPEVFARVEAEIAPLGAYLSHVGKINYRLIGDGSHAGVYPKRANSPIVGAARVLGLRSAEKFVPDAYLVGRFDDRLALLQGLMDTDGTCDARYGCASFTNTNRRLIDGVVQLVQSLGGTTGEPCEFVATHNGKPGATGWRVNIILPEGINPFSLPRKAERAALRRSWAKMTRRIVSVELVGEMEAQCILIDHPSHLYVTEAFVVTHNTHAQRNGRIDRIGQTNDVELLDLVSDHPSEQRNRDRLARKYGLRDMLTSPLDGIDDSGLAFFLKQAGVGQSAKEAALL